MRPVHGLAQQGQEVSARRAARSRPRSRPRRPSLPRALSVTLPRSLSSARECGRWAAPARRPTLDPPSPRAALVTRLAPVVWGKKRSRVKGGALSPASPLAPPRSISKARGAASGRRRRELGQLDSVTLSSPSVIRSNQCHHVSPPARCLNVSRSSGRKGARRRADWRIENLSTTRAARSDSPRRRISARRQRTPPRWPRPAS